MVLLTARPLWPVAYNNSYGTNKFYQSLKYILKYSALAYRNTDGTCSSEVRIIYPRWKSSIQPAQVKHCGCYSQLMYGKQIVPGVRNSTTPLKRMDTLIQNPSFSGSHRNMATIIGKRTQPRYSPFKLWTMQRQWNCRTYAAAATVKDIGANEIKAKVRGIPKGHISTYHQTDHQKEKVKRFNIQR